MRRGIEAYFERINRAGGVNGRRIRLVALDDSYVPDAAEENVRKLIDQEHVLALIGNVGTPTADRTIPVIEEKKVLLFGAFTGADSLLRETPPSRYVINYRASYALETAVMVDSLLARGIRPHQIAFFTQNDSYGNAGYAGAIKALKAGGYTDADRLPHGRYERNTADIKEGLMKILLAEPKPRAVIMVGTYGPCAQFIQAAKKVLPNTLFLNVSFVGSEALARALGDAGEGVIVTQVVPHFESDLPVVRDYQADMKRYDGERELGFVSLEGYIAAKIFVEGLRRAGPNPTREGLIDALERLRDLEVGLRIPITYSVDDHEGSQTVWPTILHEGRFVPLKWSELLRWPGISNSRLSTGSRAQRPE